MFNEQTSSRIRSGLAYRFNLRPDQSAFSDIDQSIRDGVEIRGTNLWLLMLAIFIASIGLNVNSTAVIIGAMLISPLMGPIMGVGYGVGINDYQLIKKALTNLLISLLIGLFTSTLYFLLSPLSTAQSELLARTTPTIWDVLIALFGGLAGIIAITRKEKSNVIPGVAIATALMPPLCTAGYGIANASMEMFLGAFYLFFINCVFIAFSTLLLMGYLNPPHKLFVSVEKERKVKRYIYAVVLATILPSIYLAYNMVNREVFLSRANDFIKNEIVFENGFIAKQKISPDKRTIDITLIGQKVSEQKLAELSGKLGHYHLGGAKLVFHQTVIKELDEASLKKTLLSEILSSNQETFDIKNSEIQQLKKEISRLQEMQNRTIESQKDEQKIVEEIQAQYPQVQQIALARTTTHPLKDANKLNVLLIDITTNKALSREEQKRIVAWLKVRAAVEQVQLDVERQ